ncbi:VOC family protein [Intrasporangium sp. DVR]|uniref:VOC family protein n=1 Tax=Intrasporangium sp. DVR TaxID=3127867 RepID=UPI00313A74DA
MYLENIVFDALDPQALGRFWETALGTETLTDEVEGFETRLSVSGGPVLDLCFPRVPKPTAEPPQRLRLDLQGSGDRQRLVDRLLALGAGHADVAAGQRQGHGPSTVLGDPEGNRFGLVPERASVEGVVRLATMSLEVADPRRDRDFWSWLTGWLPVEGSEVGLRHSSGRGPLLELSAETEPKGSGKNRVHVDVRLEPGDDADAVAQEIAQRGGRELHPGWGDLPWRIFADPSGNEFCVLPKLG